MSELGVWCVSKLVAKLESVRSAYALMANSSCHVLAVDPELMLGIFGRPRVLNSDVSITGDCKTCGQPREEFQRERYNA